jgi:multidrug efflux pump subunit AcrA (membrane-fusion protein)
MFKSSLKLIKAIFAKFKQLSIKKKLILIIVLLAIVGLKAYQYHNATKAADYELATANYDSLTEVVSETGNVTTTGSIPVYSRTTGVVEDVFIANGDTVEKNTPLFKVISTATKQEKDAALSAYLTARSKWETAKATQFSLQAEMFTEWDEFKELAESDDYKDTDSINRTLPDFHIPEKEWLAAEALYKQQEVAIKQAAANLSSTWQAYQATLDSEVRAVLGGEVRNLGVAKGDAVMAYNAATPSTNLPSLLIFNTELRTIIRVEIGETDAIKVKEKQPAEIKFDALPNETFLAHVDRVDSIAIPTEGVVKYSVYILLDEELESIKAGMTADVDITVATKENVLTVPATAVKPYEGERAVRVLDENGEIEFIPVKTGIKGDGKIEILSGISEGTEIIVALKNERVTRKSSGLF